MKLYNPNNSAQHLFTYCLPNNIIITSRMINKKLYCNIKININLNRRVTPFELHKIQKKKKILNSFAHSYFSSKWKQFWQTILNDYMLTYAPIIALACKIFISYTRRIPSVSIIKKKKKYQNKKMQKCGFEKVKRAITFDLYFLDGSFISLHMNKKYFYFQIYLLFSFYISFILVVYCIRGDYIVFTSM